MYKKLLISISMLCAVSTMPAQHLFQDAGFRKQLQQDYLRRMETVGLRMEPLFSIFDQDITTEEAEALQFLFAYMPLSDLADYDGDFFLMQARTALQARNYFEWGKRIPEDIFRHYVLAYRVNNENLDNAREVFFNELAPRLQNLSMYEAALEVNHWCHEKVAYRPSDVRTSSPLATVRTGLGRCGEESTFTVTALRAVGIPARQCYTPRWAHTDDNHAWVEVWVDGKWYFLGACEPDPELNMGWFAIPSTRTMMVHSNCFGKYTGTEEVTYQSNLFSRVNMLPNYTETRKIAIKVTDSNGRPIEGAMVRFKLYNYAEYYPIAFQETDAEGRATVTTGLGDLLIWATDGKRYGYSKMDVRATQELTIVLQRTPGEEYTEELTIVPPAERHDIVTASAEKSAVNARRLQYEDSLRNAYISTFLTEKDAPSIHNANLTQEQIGTLLKKCEGNHEQLIKLMNFNSENRRGLYLYKFLTSLSDKDLRDLDAATIQAHLTTFDAKRYPLEAYLQGIISPRISNEGIRPWRAPLREAMQRELGNNISWEAVRQWISQNIKQDDEGNYYNCPITPMGVYELRMADKHSMDIFAIACCRALDIPAYIDNASGQKYVWMNKGWQPVEFSDKQEEVYEHAKLTIDYHGNSEVKPGYYTHFTIAKYENGDFVTFDYEDDPRVATFPFTLDVEAGYYMISTGNRYSDGTTLSRMEFFNIPAGKEVTKELEIRTLIPRDVTYGTISGEFELMKDGHKTKVKELMNGKQTLVCFIDPTREPTKHLLKDIAALSSDFEKWGGSIVFAVPAGKLAPDFNFGAWNLPKQSVLLEDIDNLWFQNIITTTDQYFRNNYPVVYLINPDGTIIFKSEGYNIGTGNLILKSAKE